MTDPERLGAALGRVTRDLGMQDPGITGALFNSWLKLVGADVARRCSPTSLKEGVLRVRTDSAAWAGQMRYIGPEIARRVNQALGRDVVTEVTAWVSDGKKSSGPPKTNDRLPPSRSLPEPTEKDLAEAERIAASVADDDLKKALQKAVLAARRRRAATGGGR